MDARTPGMSKHPYIPYLNIRNGVISVIQKS
jgi:hypothetical protein